MKTLRKKQADVRKNYVERKRPTKLLSLANARKNKFDFDWVGYAPPVPKFVGVKVLEDYSLAELID